jgi:cytoskeletal protein CcmA (bactofilin family)
MAIFNKKDTLEEEVNRVSKEAISCIISKDMRITGEIIFKGKARIDGVVDGNVRGEYLVLSETGRINGDLELGALICHGAVEGNVMAKLVTAHSTASILGKLTSANLTVEPGATIEGEIHTSSKGSTETNKKPIPTGINKEQQEKEEKKTTK